MSNFKPCILIPVYNHEKTIESVIESIIDLALDCILIDDGSSEVCAKVLDEVSKKYKNNVYLFRHLKNSGKGAALITGFKEAAKLGYSHALQIDSDGQHNLCDIKNFLKASENSKDALVVGYPIYDDSVPKIRYYFRYLTHFWVCLNTLSFKIKDSMCGFRVYPLKATLDLVQNNKFSQRMGFDIEILVKLYWKGIKIINLPTKVSYPQDGISHFKLFSDNLEISMVHCKLCLGMLLRFPKLISYWWKQ